MNVQLWNAYSCNNSSDYRLVARFRHAGVAESVARELREFFSAYAAELDKALEENDYEIPEEPIPVATALAEKLGFAWNEDDFLSWGDEGLSDNEPAVASAGATVAIYHDYCGGFTDNIVRALVAWGGEVEPEERRPPDLSVRFRLPKGESGERVAGELATFLNQKLVHEDLQDFQQPPPWGEQGLSGAAEGVVWFRDRDVFAFKMPFPLSGFDALRVWLAERALEEVDVRLCDEEEIAALEARDTLLELDRRISSSGPLTELDLTGRRLRFVPKAVLDLPSLRRLVLDDNPLRAIPKEIASLAQLEELRLAGCGLTTLPDELAGLGKLRILDLSKNPLAALPAVVGKFPELRELGARMLRGVDLSALACAVKLQKLDLGFLRPKEEDGLLAFPREILALRDLRELDLSVSALAELPDELTQLTNLEVLNLDGAVGRLDRLPPLHELPKLRSLSLAGGAGNTDAYARHALLEGVWKIDTLERLGIDRYGAEKEKRGPLTSLPDDAFARMKGLRVLDLSFNELERLPESFYALEKLESVDLRYTKLDRATLDRLAKTFPRVRLDLRNVKTRFDVDDPHWKDVNGRVKAGASKAGSGDRAGAVADFEAALALCTQGTVYSDYDELYALYGLVEALGHLRLAAAEGAEKEALGDKLVRYATRALELVPPPGAIWHFTDAGAFQEEVTRRAGNALAWMLMERGELDRALAVVERALCAGGERGYVFDTKVRILLKAGRNAEAYAIVESILTEDPAFADFQDLAASPGFEAWKRNGRPVAGRD